MPEKSVKQITEELKLIAQYKWEFLRRNKQYCDDYTRYVQEEQRLRLEYNEDKFNQWQEDQVSEFHAAWGINWPSDPSEKSTEYLYDISYDGPPVQRQMKHNFKTMKGVEKRYYPTWADIPVRVGDSEIRIPDTVVFGFNLNYPTGKIMPLFKKELDKLMKQRKELLKQHNIKPSYRQAQIKPLSPKKKNLYDEYLRIWDFNELNKGKTWAWKAKRLYPNGAVSEHMLLERYKACKELIDGGYIDIK